MHEQLVTDSARDTCAREGKKQPCGKNQAARKKKKTSKIHKLLLYLLVCFSLTICKMQIAATKVTRSLSSSPM